MDDPPDHEKPGARDPSHGKFARDGHTRRAQNDYRSRIKHAETTFTVEEELHLADGTTVLPGIYSADRQHNWEILDALKAGETQEAVAVVTHHDTDGCMAPPAKPLLKGDEETPEEEQPHVKHSRRGPVVSTNEPRNKQALQPDNTVYVDAVVKVATYAPSKPLCEGRQTPYAGCKCPYCRSRVEPDKGSRSNTRQQKVSDQING